MRDTTTRKMQRQMQSKYVPWDEPWEWALWITLTIVIAFAMHNTLRVYKESGRPHP